MVRETTDVDSPLGESRIGRFALILDRLGRRLAAEILAKSAFPFCSQNVLLVLSFLNALGITNKFWRNQWQE